MIVTMNKVMILDQTEQLINMIFQSELYESYKEKKAAVQKDEEARRLIQAFNRLKERYEEVQRFGKYHPDFDQVSTEMRKLKRTVDLHETIVAFKKAEEDLQLLFNDISKTLAYAVSKSIKVPTGNPYFDALPHQCGCSSNKGCGCK